MIEESWGIKNKTKYRNCPLLGNEAISWNYLGLCIYSRYSLSSVCFFFLNWSKQIHEHKSWKSAVLNRVWPDIKLMRQKSFWSLFRKSFGITFLVRLGYWLIGLLIQYCTLLSHKTFTKRGFESFSLWYSFNKRNISLPHNMRVVLYTEVTTWCTARFHSWKRST